MAGIPSIGVLSAALENERIAVEFSVRALRAQLDAVENAGAQAVRLIEAATIDPDIGRTIDFQI